MSSKPKKHRLPRKGPPTKRTWWVDTNRTASMIMTANGRVVWVGADSWRRLCMGRTIKDALAALAEREHYAVVRKVLSYHYFTPTDLED